MLSQADDVAKFWVQQGDDHINATAADFLGVLKEESKTNEELLQQLELERKQAEIDKEAVLEKAELEKEAILKKSELEKEAISKKAELDLEAKLKQAELDKDAAVKAALQAAKL